MKTIGITGGIGSGKSVVCKILKVLNYPIYDTDSQAKILMTKSDVLKSRLKTLIGEDVYKNDEINRVKMSSFIFSSEVNRNRVNAIVHPEVFAHFNKWRLEQNSDIVFIESAILHESGLGNMVDEVWCVIADKEVRIDRVMERNGLSRSEVLSRINSQTPDEDIIRLSDYTIDNSGNSSLLRQIIKLL